MSEITFNAPTVQFVETPSGPAVTHSVNHVTIGTEQLSRRTCAVTSYFSHRTDSSIGVLFTNVAGSCDNRKRATALHELMHVLNYHHEHQRPDRNQYISFKPGENYDKNYDLDIRGRPYDTQSITNDSGFTQSRRQAKMKDIERIAVGLGLGEMVGTIFNEIKGKIVGDGYIHVTKLSDIDIDSLNKDYPFESNYFLSHTNLVLPVGETRSVFLFVKPGWEPVFPTVGPGLIAKLEKQQENKYAKVYKLTLTRPADTQYFAASSLNLDLQDSNGQTGQLTLNIAASEPEKVNLPALPQAVPLWLIADQKCLQAGYPIFDGRPRQVTLASCDSANPAQRWYFSQSQLRNEFYYSNRCLRVAKYSSKQRDEETVNYSLPELAACDAAAENQQWTYSEKRFQTQEGAPLWVHRPNGLPRDDNALWSWQALQADPS